MHSSSRWLALVWAVCLSVLHGCGFGTAAIGAGLAGGGGGSDSVPAPLAQKPAVLFQPLDDQTLVALRFAQPGSRQVRLYFEYDIGSGRTRVPTSSLAAYDPTAQAVLPPFDTDEAGNLVVKTSPGGVDVWVLWNHLADLGHVEQRGVSLFAVFADIAAAPGFAAAAGSSVQLLAQATVGRELGVVAESVLQRPTTDPESVVLFSTVLRDRGADRPSTSFLFEYATTDTPPGDTDFTALTDLVPSEIVDSELPDGRQRSALTFSVDPYTNLLPIGTHEHFWLRVTHREDYPANRADQQQSGKVGTPQVLELTGAAATFGKAPRILNAKVVDPSQQVASGVDRPWLRLPIAVTIENPSARVSQRIRLGGQYRFGAEWYTLTPIASRDPRGAFEFDLAPGERRLQSMLWNVAYDEGLGMVLDDVEAPFSAQHRAEVKVDATLVGLSAGSLGGGVLRAEASAGFATLSTNPFVRFRENLLDDAWRVWSSGEDASQDTRDLFYTKHGSIPQETELGISQQFEPIQLVPAPGLTSVGPVYDLVPTDFAPGSPDCLVWAASRMIYCEWHAGDPVATTEELPGLFGASGSRGTATANFTLNSAQGRYHVAVFYVWGERTVSGNKEVDVEVFAVVRDQQGAWSVVRKALQTFHLHGTPGVEIRVVDGEFDGDSATHEYVLGCFGAEDALSTRPLLHQWTFSVAGTGVVCSDPQALARPPLPTRDPDRPMSRWLLSRWLDGASGRHELVLVRQLDGWTTRPREWDVLVLRRPNGAGFASGWSILSEALTAGGTFFPLGTRQLESIYAPDLDGALGGSPGSDLVLAFRQDVAGERTTDLWVFAQRGSQPPVWRRLAKGIRVQDPAGNPAPGNTHAGDFRIVDVNGDGLLDLLTVETVTGQNPHWNYFASSLSGVAGTMDSLGAVAGNSTNRSRLPGALDVDRDGDLDLISGNSLFLAQADETYAQNIGGFTGSTSAKHRVGRIWLDGPQDQVEILVSDASNNANNRIDRLSGLGSGPYAATSVLGYSLGTAGTVQEALALMTPASNTSRTKEIVALVGDATTSTLHRGSITGSTVVGAPLWAGQVATPRGIALVRRGEVPAGSSLADSTLVQDVVVVQAGTGTLQVFESHTGYLPRTLAGPTNETVVRVAAGSVGTDRYEDLCVLTVQGSVYRVWAYMQDPDPARGIGQPLGPVLLMQFDTPYANAATRTFQFDQDSHQLAEGLMLLTDDQAATTRSEVRLIRPLAAPQSGALGVGSHVVRSPLRQAFPFAVDIVLTDTDRDGLIEVIGGEQSASSTGLRRLRINHR